MIVGIEVGGWEGGEGLKLFSCAEVAHSLEHEVLNVVKLVVEVDLEFCVAGLIGSIDYEDVETEGKGEMVGEIGEDSGYGLVR